MLANCVPRRRSFSGDAERGYADDNDTLRFEEGEERGAHEEIKPQLFSGMITVVSVQLMQHMTFMTCPFL